MSLDQSPKSLTENLDHFFGVYYKSFTLVLLCVDLWQIEGSISAQKCGNAGFTNQKICAWHSMERCILDTLLSDVSQLLISFSVLFYLFPQWLHSLLKEPHQTLVSGANPAVFTHPDCNDPALCAQLFPSLAQGDPVAFSATLGKPVQGLGQPSDHPGSIQGARPPVCMCWEDQCQMSSTGHIWAPSEPPFTGLLSAWLMCPVSGQLWSCP